MSYTVGGHELTRQAAVEYAEARLGRPLTDGERHLDLVGLDLDLAEGKERLTDAIEAAKRDAIRRLMLYGGTSEIRVTDEILAVMEALVDAGRRHALAEFGSMGVEPTPPFRAFEEGDVRLTRLLQQLIGLLTTIRVRLTEEANAAEFQGSNEITEELLERLDERVPGARDAASRLVSSLLLGGLGEVYERNAHLFPCFHYSAVMDSATCEPCRSLDGREYRTWEQGERDLPGGGPNPLCLGDGRCRCRLVPCPPGERVEPAPPPEPEPIHPSEARGPNVNVLALSDQDVADAIEAIGRVHRLPAGILPFRVAEKTNVPWLGQMTASTPDHPYAEIRIKRFGDERQATFAHEFGHYLDWSVFGDGQRWASEGRDDRLREWRDAVYSSQRVRDLTWERSEVPDDLRAFLTYLLSDAELWARSYAQWVALRAGGALGDEQSRKRYGWGDEDFGPIADAFDNLFRGLISGR